ncbi:metallophosphoesterase family protein [Primorskyibacter aestuariivivens]|uniref:metallophosphoesterase family protein n=1 Tax=Primorskyibacter aestuariivivens TaxID=1888912 RepID=UPI0023010598|nr:metallophosphoesterase family protein [Primorskyibacter aestuariivivens]MDA7430136.1 metallophosphoesterase family protein [Primorskyibacter aestuariivivens]
MKIADLGRIAGPVLLFGGPYSNAEAFGALMELGWPRGRMICTGDVVAYCAAPGACVAMAQRIEQGGGMVIAGNVEQQLAARALDCGCGFEDGSACDLLSDGWYGFANAAVDDAARDWMADLPDIGVFEHAGRRFAVIHGGASDVARFLWPSSPEADFTEEIAGITDLIGPVDGVIAGHCGVAFTRDMAGVSWINAGVIGMPPHDGRPATRYAVLDAGRVRIERLDYDWQTARTAMVAAGLTQGYHEALSAGIWPSEDVLPVAMRRG